MTVVSREIAGIAERGVWEGECAGWWGAFLDGRVCQCLALAGHSRFLIGQSYAMM